MESTILIIIVVALFQFFVGRLNKLVEKSKTTANTWDDWVWGILYTVASAISGLVNVKNLTKKKK